MPEIARFFGISIKMYYDDHAPPHFHAEYGGDIAVVDIQTLLVMGGDLPPRALGMVVEWGALYRKELLEDWDLASAYQPLRRLPPLK